MTDTKNSVPTRAQVFWRPLSYEMIDGTEYSGRTWQYPSTPGQNIKMSRVKWDHIADEPFSLYGRGSETLLEECKCFLWTMLFDRLVGRPMAYGSIARIVSGLTPIVNWMFENGLTSFSQITNQRSWSFLEWFRDNHARPRDGKKRERLFTWSTAWQTLKTLVDIYDQTDALNARGFEPMLEAPFDGRSPYDLVSTEYGLRKGDKLHPIPDHVALPVLTMAAKWVEERAPDIVRLERIWLEEMVPFEGRPERTKRGRDILRSFAVSNDPETGKPWTTLGEETGWERMDTDGIRRMIPPGDQPRRLVSDLLSACMIVVLGTTGMRASDLASVRVEPEHDFPSCITMKRSLDGLIEYFLLEGVEKKSSHERHSWVLGARLSDTQDYPLPVKALIVINRLLEPYRRATKVKDLILTFSEARSMALLHAAPNASSSWITNCQREFANNYANVLLRKHVHSSGKSEDGVAFRSQQWRDTFAVFVVRTNKRALGPLATHFNHVSTLMTELGYIGNDPELLQLVDDARVSLATNIIADLVDEDAPVEGGLAVLLKDAISELRTELGDADAEERLERIRGTVIDYGLRLHFTDYGMCGAGVVPAIARCHQVVGDESTIHRHPNFATRKPSLCLGCKNFLVNRANLPYWEQRVTDLERAMPTPGEARTWRHQRELALSRRLVNALKEALNGREAKETA